MLETRILFLKLRIISSPIPELADNYLIVWTTTPWTLLANVALAVGEDIDYVLVENTREFKSGEKLIEKYVLAKARLSVLDGETVILKEFKGKDLIGTRYEQILPYTRLIQMNTQMH